MHLTGPRLIEGAPETPEVLRTQIPRTPTDLDERKRKKDWDLKRGDVNAGEDEWNQEEKEKEEHRGTSLSNGFSSHLKELHHHTISFSRVPCCFQCYLLLLLLLYLLTASSSSAFISLPFFFHFHLSLSPPLLLLFHNLFA